MNITEREQTDLGEAITVRGIKGKLSLFSTSGVREGSIQLMVSSQYGCSMGCLNCSAPRHGQGVNASFNDLIGQVNVGTNRHKPENIKSLVVGFNRVGEPTWNLNVIMAAVHLMGRSLRYGIEFFPTLTTMMPRYNKRLEAFLGYWLDFKNNKMGGCAGLEICIESTSDNQRGPLFNSNSHELDYVSKILSRVVATEGLKGERIILRFTTPRVVTDPKTLHSLFSPKYFSCRLSPSVAEMAKPLTKEGYQIISI